MLSNIFTYGSLMFKPVWQHVVGRFDVDPAPSILVGYQRYRVRGESYPAMIAQDGGQTPGVVYSGVSSEQVNLLDRFEGDKYQRIEVTVMLSASIHLKAQAYLFLDTPNIEHAPWDPDAFEQHDLLPFLQRHGNH